MGGEGKVYTLTEVSQHNNAKDCWLVIEGNVPSLQDSELSCRPAALCKSQSVRVVKGDRLEICWSSPVQALEANLILIILKEQHA
ncbi:hypothetical protein CRYUN_Cryun14cG0135700 [Craigia yunnanensis]